MVIDITYRSFIIIFNEKDSIPAVLAHQVIYFISFHTLFVLELSMTEVTQDTKITPLTSSL
jgi:hypothetical protein